MQTLVDLERKKGMISPPPLGRLDEHFLLIHFQSKDTLFHDFFLSPHMQNTLESVPIGIFKNVQVWIAHVMLKNLNSSNFLARIWFSGFSQLNIFSSFQYLK